MEQIPKSPLAKFMKGLMTSKNFDCTEIVPDNPRRLSCSSSGRPLLRATGEARDKQKERWEFSEKNESECINCPQRRDSIDDDDFFCSDEEFSASYSVDDEEDTNSHTTSTASTPLPSCPLSPSFGSDEKDHTEKNRDNALPYQMALRMVQKKYAASSLLSSPAQSPIQPPKKLVSGIRGDASLRRLGA